MILFITIDGSIVPIAYYIKRVEGVDNVVYYYKTTKDRPLEQVVDYVDSLSAGLAKKPKCIVVDGNGIGEVIDKLRKSGYKVVGGGSLNDRLEYDRKFGLELIKMCGVSIGETFKFNNIKEVEDFILENKELFVLKPFGDKNNFLTFIPKNRDELMIYIQWLKSSEYGKGKWLLQEKFEGYEISTELWFSKGKPLYRANYTLETKKRDVNDLGPTVGASTSVLFGAYKDEPYIVQKVFKKLYLLMEKVGYTGPLDINCIVNENKVYGLEWTPRLGWNATFALIELLNMPVSEFFIKVAEGSLDRIEYKPGYSYALRVVMPEYPLEDKEVYKKYKGLPIYFDEKYKNNIWLLGADLGDKFFEVKTNDGIVLEISSYDDKDMFNAEKKAIDIFNNLLLPNKTARVGDGAKHAYRRYQGLKRLGFWF